jgi:Uncharacterized proteins, LmbE homologs
MSGFLDNLGPPIGVADLLGGRPLAVLAPHPDDETLGCGALLFDAAAHGARCTVICVTDDAPLSRMNGTNRQSAPAPRRPRRG